jgi:hypothetical protein
MTELLASLRTALVGSPVSQAAEYLLRNIPGFPPISQTVHLIGISVVMGSAVMLNLNVLGLALRSYRTPELTRRLLPWTWWALPFLAVSGLLFIFARPNRYLRNPVVGIKFALLVPALVLTAVYHIPTLKDPEYWERPTGRRVTARIVAGVSLCLWLTIVMAGRWIAYAEYLFPPD